MVDKTGLDKSEIDETAVDEIAVDEPGPNRLNSLLALFFSSVTLFRALINMCTY